MPSYFGIGTLPSGFIGVLVHIRCKGIAVVQRILIGDLNNYHLLILAQCMLWASLELPLFSSEFRKVCSMIDRRKRHLPVGRYLPVISISAKPISV